MSLAIPTLRFKIFTGLWDVDSLGSLTIFRSGSTPSKSRDDYWGGDIPWISASSMHSHYFYDSDKKVTKKAVNEGAKVAKVGTILLLVRGSMLFNKIPVGIVTKNVTFNQDVKAISLKSGKCTRFLFYWFLSYENRLLNMVTGTGIGAGKLDTDDLKALQFYQPKTNLEQQKIADFLTSVDDKISQLSKKQTLLTTYKKGVMQQLFSQQIRFKDENGNAYSDWEEVKVGDLITSYRELATQHNQYPVLTSSRKGIFFQKDYYTRDVASEDTTGYNVVPRGYFTYRHMSDDLIFKFNLNTLCDKGIVSTLYPVFKAIDELIHASFLQIVLNEGKEFKRFAILQKQGGSRTYMYLNKLNNLLIAIPSVNEQQKIMQFLQSIDNKILIVTEQIEKSKTFKKGLLQQMFV